MKGNIAAGIRSLIKKPPVYRWIGLQALFALLVSAGFLVESTEAAISAVLGGALFLLPQLYFVHKAYAHTGARAVRRVLMGFYQGESGKLMLTAAAFALVFKFYEPLNIRALFVTFISTMLLNALWPLIVEHRFFENKVSGTQ